MLCGTAVSAETHKLPATDKTTWTGYFDASIPPVLKIKSGDTVETQTLMLYNDKLKPGATIADVMKWRAELVAEKKTSHTLTGPIYINGAEPGDVLQIDIIKLTPRAYSYTYNIPGEYRVGGVPEDFPEAQLKLIPLDVTKKTAKFNDNITLPIRPFLGIMGVAPAQDGRVSTAPPSNFGGNMDLKHLIRERPCSCRSSARADSSPLATRMPAWATARSTSPPWKPRWTTSCSASPCARI